MTKSGDLGEGFVSSSCPDECLTDPLLMVRYSRMVASRARVLQCAPGLICFSVRVANKRSTKFSKEALVGVKMRLEPGDERTIAGRAASCACRSCPARARCHLRVRLGFRALNEGSGR